MGIKDIKAGKYTGAIASIKHPETQEEMAGKVIISGKGTQGVQFIFEFEREAGAKERLMWTGWLTEAAKERTFETLAMLGFNEEVKVIGNEQFFPRSSFVNSPPVQLVVDLEPQLNADQTPKLDPTTHQPMFYPRISWVNDMNKFGFSKSENGAMLTGINLKQEMLVARQKLGLGAPGSTARPQIKNHAPGAANGGNASSAPGAGFGPEPTMSFGEEVPF